MNGMDVNLIPGPIRDRTLAGLRAGRLLACSLIVLGALALVSMHARWSRERVQERLLSTQVEADQALRIESQAVALRAESDAINQFVNRYRRVALPIEMTGIMATVINTLPASVTIESIDLDIDVPPPGRRIPTGSPIDRVVRCRLAGFAASDGDIAELVARLETTPPFDGVSMQYSRSGTVRGRSARFFQLGFHLDLERLSDDASTGSLALETIEP